MDYQYDVVLSFAGEDREYVEQVAILLKKNNVRVFYDRFEQANLWGKNLYNELSVVYSTRSKYCIIFVSQHYIEKDWTNLELESIQERSFTQRDEYTLPVRFDNSVLKGLKKTIGYLDANIYSPDKLVNLFLEKIGKKTSPKAGGVLLRFDNNYKIDLSDFYNSVTQFADWSSLNVQMHLPVNVIFPFNVEQRIDTYRKTLSNIPASSEISQEAIDQATKSYSHEYLQQEYFDKLIISTRRLYSLFLDKILNKEEFEIALQIFSSCKLISLIRNFLNFRLINTIDEDWLQEFYIFSSDYGSGIMNSLPYVLKRFEKKQILFWVDFDLYSRFVEPIRSWLYLPDNLLLKSFDNYNEPFFEKIDFVKYIVPQLLDLVGTLDIELYTIRSLIEHVEDIDVTPREEKYYRVDNYRFIGNFRKDIEVLYQDFLKKLQEVYDEAIVKRYKMRFYRHL